MELRPRKHTAARGSSSAQDMGTQAYGRLRKQCGVCGEEKTIARGYPHRAITSQCDHEINTCRLCVRKWIDSELKSKKWDDIACIECQSKLSHEDVKANASSSTYEKYNTISIHAALAAMPDFLWCQNPNCNEGQVHHYPEDGEVFSCQSCYKQTCLVCQTEWHPDQTHEEVQADRQARLTEIKRQNKAAEAMIAKISKPCPKCNSPIEKNGGCNHMRCVQCNHEFCWICLADNGAFPMESVVHLPGCSAARNQQEVIIVAEYMAALAEEGHRAVDAQDVLGYVRQALEQLSISIQERRDMLIAGPLPFLARTPENMTDFREAVEGDIARFEQREQRLQAIVAQMEAL